MAIYGVLQLPPLPAISLLYHCRPCLPVPYLPIGSNGGRRRHGNGRILAPVFVNQEDNPSTSSSISTSVASQERAQQGDDPDPQDIEYVSQIRTVLDRLRKTRNMLFEEVKLTIMIEDPRDVERRRLLGIDDNDAPTRDDLATALEQVNEGQIPKDRAALKILAEEMLEWPNLEVEAPKKKQPGKSLYAKVTDTGIDPQEAAKRLNVDWDSAADIEDVETADAEMPSAVGYGALYLITAFPIIIGAAASIEWELSNGNTNSIEYNLQTVVRKLSQVHPLQAQSSADFTLVSSGIVDSLWPPRHQRIITLSWNLPLTGFLKLNVDGSRLQSGSAGGGLIARDDTGRAIFCKDIYFVISSNFQAELMALKHGLQCCTSLNLG